MDNKEKIKKLLQDEDFITKLLEMQTREEVQEEFKRQGIDVSLEEVGELGSIINYLIKEEKTQLSEEDLVKISGGTGPLARFGAWVTGGSTQNIEEARAKKWGEVEVVALTAIIAIPIAVGVTKLATWGFDKLIKKLDEKTDENKAPATK
ncbi:MAG: hypothetical protein IKE05_05565 [Clostridia bacterium]|nr:hypothetical protein [Clostridia bacterium]